jgi:hypothetical protein
MPGAPNSGRPGVSGTCLQTSGRFLHLRQLLETSKVRIDRREVGYSTFDKHKCGYGDVGTSPLYRLLDCGFENKSCWPLELTCLASEKGDVQWQSSPR